MARLALARSAAGLPDLCGDTGRRSVWLRGPRRQHARWILRQRAGLGGRPSKFRDVMRDVLALERDQRCVHDRVHREMPLAPAQPGCGVVGTAQRCDPERERVNAKLQFLAVSALEDFQVDRHTVGWCNRCTVTQPPQRFAWGFKRYKSRW